MWYVENESVLIETRQQAADSIAGTWGKFTFRGPKILKSKQ